MGVEKYMSWDELHMPGAVPNKLLYLRHQAQQGASRGNALQVSGTSQYAVLYTQCAQGMMVVGTLSMIHDGPNVGAYQLSIPGHASTDCTDAACPCRKIRPNPGRVARFGKQVGNLLETAFHGGEPVWVGSLAKPLLIRPCQSIDSYS